jgi:hypothetical protein
MAILAATAAMTEIADGGAGSAAIGRAGGVGKDV